MCGNFLFKKCSLQVALRLLPAQREGSEFVLSASGFLVPLPPPPGPLASGPDREPDQLALTQAAPSVVCGNSVPSGRLCRFCFQEILPLTSPSPCPSSPLGDRGWGGFSAIYYLPVLVEADRLAPGGGLGLGRWSPPSISCKY